MRFNPNWKSYFLLLFWVFFFQGFVLFWILWGRGLFCFVSSWSSYFLLENIIYSCSLSKYLNLFFIIFLNAFLIVISYFLYLRFPQSTIESSLISRLSQKVQVRKWESETGNSFLLFQALRITWMQVVAVLVTEDQSYWKSWGIFTKIVLLKAKEARNFTCWFPALIGWWSILRVLNSWHSWAISGAGWESSCSSRENPRAKVEKDEIQGYLWWKAVSMCVGTVHGRYGEPSHRPRRYGTQTVSIQQC